MAKKIIETFDIVSLGGTIDDAITTLMRYKDLYGIDCKIEETEGYFFDGVKIHYKRLETGAEYKERLKKEAQIERSKQRQLERNRKEYERLKKMFEPDTQ